ncbi:MAG: type II secretion system F family protein [Candidatus Sumerlaeia bacterium]
MRKRHVSLEDLTTFLRELERLARNNLPLDAGIEQIAAREDGSLAILAARVQTHLRRGVPLAQALSEEARISPYAVALLKAGEESGAMAAVLRDAALFCRRALVARRAIIHAARYPAVVLAIFCLLMLFISFFVLPRMELLFAEIRGVQSAVSDLPPLTNLVIAVGRAVRLYCIHLLVAAVIAILFWRWFRRTPVGRVIEGNVILRIPGLGMAVYYDSLGRYCRSLGQMLARGVPIDAAVMLAAGAVDSLIARQMAGRIARRLGGGGTLWEGMADTRVFTPVIVWMVQKAEETGDVAEALLEAADFYDERFDEAGAAIRDLIEPILIISLGLVMGLFIIGLYHPLLRFTYFF